MIIIKYYVYKWGNCFIFNFIYLKIIKEIETKPLFKGMYGEKKNRKKKLKQKEENNELRLINKV